MENEAAEKKVSAGRVLIKPRGDWDANVTYNMLDLVNHNGYAFLAKKTVVGIEPSDDYPEYWHNMLDIKKIVDKTIAELVADDVGDILEKRLGDRLGEVENRISETEDRLSTVEDVCDDVKDIPEKINTLEDNTYTKDETLSDEARGILGIEAKSTPNTAFTALHSKLAQIPSYLTFVGNANANADMVSAAFGKGNEDEILGVGKALAMYGWFKGEDKTQYPFINLQKMLTINNMNRDVYDEIILSDYLSALTIGNTYAVEKMYGIYEASISEEECPNDGEEKTIFTDFVVDEEDLKHPFRVSIAHSHTADTLHTSAYINDVLIDTLNSKRDGDSVLHKETSCVLKEWSDVGITSPGTYTVKYNCKQYGNGTISDYIGNYIILYKAKQSYDV